MKITTWNVNSLRSRLDYVTNFVRDTQPDVLCLQETKVTDDIFPREPFEAMGYTCYIHGQKSYNGVALISKVPLENVTMGFQHTNPEPALLEQARFISGTLNGVRILNAYVPQGESVDSPKFAFKRQFYAGLRKELDLYTPETPLVLLADFNICRSELDVDNVKKRQGKCMFTDEEHSWLQTLEDWGLTDAYRAQNPDVQTFSWWDYRQLAFQLNRGLRIDWHYVSTPLLSKVTGFEHAKDERKREKPSDHIPVTMELAL